MSGKVYLLGAGPGDPELLTLKALKILQSADVVLHDDLVSAEIIRLLPATALVIDVGKRSGRLSVSQHEINRLLVDYGVLGLTVVRLKGGDPFIFGRGGEELESLREAGIDCQVVPGITAALGAAAATQVPLTHRDLASSVLFLTGHRAHEIGLHLSNADLARTTVVIYMPGSDYGRTRQELISAGIKAKTPCIMVSQATTPQQQTHLTTLERLPESPELPAPALLIVGEVARLANTLPAASEFHFATVAPPFALESAL